jgi:hypothetical protein
VNLETYTARSRTPSCSASDSALDPAAWGADGGELVADLDADLTGALVLTDDFAPVDQLILDAR